MKPFLHGKKNLGTLSLVSTGGPLAIANSPSLRPNPVVSGAASPSIDVVKEGDKVVRLVITCACGERMEVECIYPAGS